MIFDILFSTMLVLPPIFAVINTRNKQTLEGHLTTSGILAVFAFLFGILYGLEKAIGAPSIFPVNNVSVFGSSLGILAPAFSGMIIVFVDYIVSVIVAWLIDTSLEKFKV